MEQEMAAAPLDSLVAGVQQAVEEAKRAVVTAEQAASHWQQLYEQEYQLRERLEQEQRQRQEDGEEEAAAGHEQQHAAAAASATQPSTYTAAASRTASDSAATIGAAASGVGGKLGVIATGRPAPVAPASPPPPPSTRRHTAPALLPMPDMLDHLNSTASRLEKLRQELERDLESGHALEGSLALSRLSSMLAACSFLRDASAAAAGAGGCPAAADLGGSCSRGEGEEGQEVALHDDGAAGVGATAAAAVSVALAQSWAAAAGARQAAVRHAATAQGVVRPGKARFKLIAAVPRNYHRHQSQHPNGRDRHMGDSPRRAALHNAADGSSALPHSPSASLLLGHSPSAPSLRGGLQHKGQPYESTNGLVSLGEAEPNSMDDDQEARWRASGQHLKLQWLSPPSTILVVYKPVPAVFDSCVAAIAWLLRRGMTVYVEPAVHAELTEAVQQYLQAGSGTADATAAGAKLAEVVSSSVGSSMDSGDSWPGPAPTPAPTSLPPRPKSEFIVLPPPPPPLSAELSTLPPRPAPVLSSLPPRHIAGQSSSSAGNTADGTTNGTAVDLERQLLTWEEPPCGCPPAVPCSVGHQLDLVITLGGDGTVLWTCGLFAAGAVPPLVPFAMGSLGFMTPFQIGQMEEVLSKVTGLERGVALMLRHRLQCRIIRGNGNGNGSAYSSADLVSEGGGSDSASAGGDPAAADYPSCKDEYVVLNEVVIDRGMKAQLCNLQCYADQNHVTVVQGDGLIVATPTGSTAYNLAAGGAMVHPGVPCFMFTPICPHSLSSRPLVLPEHLTLRVKVPLDSRSSAFCSFDGRGRQELRPGDSVLISMSRWPAPMVCNLDASHDYFLSMREGLCWNVRKQQKGRGQ